MVIVDTALRAREEQGKPIRVAFLGAGFMVQGLANQIVHSTPGMRVVGIYSRKLDKGLRLFQYAGLTGGVASNQTQVDDMIRRGQCALVDDGMLLARSEQVDVIVDVTGSVEFGARVVLEAFRN